MTILGAPYLAALIIGVLISTPAFAQEREHEEARAQIIERLYMGEALSRDDLVLDALERLYRVSPDDDEALAAELRMAIRQQDRDKAHELLRRLEQSAPESPHYVASTRLLELTTPQAQSRLTQARLLAAAGRSEDALALYDALFKGIYPTSDFALEYWQLRARLVKDRELALQQLQAELSKSPFHSNLLYVLADLLLRQDEPQQAIPYLRRLAQQPRHRLRAAQREYRFLREQPPTEDGVARWANFMDEYGELELAQLARPQWETQKALVEDRVWRAGHEAIKAIQHSEQASLLVLKQLQQAVTRYPEDPAFNGYLGVAYLRARQPAVALNYFETAVRLTPRTEATTKWRQLINSTHYWMLLEQADAKLQARDWTQAKRLYERAHVHNPRHVFALVGLIDSALGLEDKPSAWRYAKQAMSLAPTDEAAQRGMQRYLLSLPTEDALEQLHTLPAKQQRVLAETRRSLLVSSLRQQAQEAHEQGDPKKASELLYRAQSLNLDDPWISYQLAVSLRDLGLEADAMYAYGRHLNQHSGHPETHYAHALLLSSVNALEPALATMAVVPRAQWSSSMVELHEDLVDRQRIYEATLLYKAGKRQAAFTLLEAEPVSLRAHEQLGHWSIDEKNYPKALQHFSVVAHERPSDIEVQRYIAQSLRYTDQPSAALNTYAFALLTAGELEQNDVDPIRNDVAFTRALRAQESDDWLLRGIRSEAAELYEQQNPEITVHQDHWLRTDGTRGYSRLNSNVTMAHLEYPLRQGRAFLRFDHVMMDAGALKADGDDGYTGRFGSCSFAAQDMGGQWRALPGCQSDLHQKASGTSAAIGWYNDKWSIDLGTTPKGFRVSHIVGGITYKGDFNKLGWSLTASRRPMSNTVLSFAGLKDPRTGTVWGGVVADGVTLGLSWDQGGRDGYWANLSYHRLTGKNVESNTRARAMAGYYRRLINKPQERLSAGINVMYWRYAKDLGEFTLGHGGYYSPQRYMSLSLPVSYARRTQDWSFLLQGSISVSRARSAGGTYYPLGSTIAQPMAQLAQQGGTTTSFQTLNRFSSAQSSGLGYRLAANVERRLSKHWVLGAGVDWQHSKDYSPSRFMLYLRYRFKPWQGDLRTTPEPLEPYAEFR